MTLYIQVYIYKGYPPVRVRNELFVVLPLLPFYRIAHTSQDNSISLRIKGLAEATLEQAKGDGESVDRGPRSADLQSAVRDDYPTLGLRPRLR
jgi:hypothetical protein